MKGALSKNLKKELEISSGKAESVGKGSCVMRAEYNHRISPKNSASDSCESL